MSAMRIVRAASLETPGRAGTGAKGPGPEAAGALPPLPLARVGDPEPTAFSTLDEPTNRVEPWTRPGAAGCRFQSGVDGSPPAIEWSGAHRGPVRGRRAASRDRHTAGRVRRGRRASAAGARLPRLWRRASAGPPLGWRRAAPTVSGSAALCVFCVRRVDVAATTRQGARGLDRRPTTAVRGLAHECARGPGCVPRPFGDGFTDGHVLRGRAPYGRAAGAERRNAAVAVARHRAMTLMHLE